MSRKPTIMRVAQGVLSSAYTLYLFTKSDTPLVIFPMLTVAMVLAGPTDWSSFSMALLWLELHLLAFDASIKNQIIGVEEDKLCKPYRPFPSGRISLEHGQILYLLVIALSMAISAYNGLTKISLIYMLAIWMYNEFGLSMHPIPKSPLGAVGYMCYCWGTTYIIGHHQPMTNTSMTAIFTSGLIFTTTGHAQDFRDLSGDAAIGRKTIPMILPQSVARWSLLSMILAWTYGLILLWHPPKLASAIFTFLGFTVATKFVANCSEDEDRKSFRWYEIWLIGAHVLPIFARMSSGELSSPFPQGLNVTRPAFVS